MSSRWNRLLDDLLAADLTVAEHRLALALARLLLGWNRTQASLGQRILREAAGLDGRTFGRALAGLTEKGLVRVTTPGPRQRSTYELLPAPQRADKPTEVPAPQRADAAKPSARSHDTNLPALQRGRIGSGKGKASEPPHTSTSTAVDETQLRRDAFDAYLSTGGSLTLDRERSTLARAVTAAHNAGTDPRLILAAARDLGRNREFPGYLKQRIADLQDRGGSCHYQGLDRSRMTPDQLDQCGCSACTEWAAFARERAHPPAQTPTPKTVAA